MKSKLITLPILVVVYIFFAFSQIYGATTNSYSASNFQSTACLKGSEFIPSNLSTQGDIITVTGSGFGNRNLYDGIPEMVYVPSSKGVLMVYKGLGSIDGVNDSAFGLLSWTDSEIQFEVAPGLGETLGSYIILRKYSSSSDNNGVCTRGALATYVPPPPTCNSFTYSDWGMCSNGKQIRAVTSSSPTDCTGGTPVLTQLCTVPTCTSFIYSDWGICTKGQQMRTVGSSSPSGCTGGGVVLTQPCTPIHALPRIISVTPSVINQSDVVEIIGENFGSVHNGYVVTLSGEKQSTSNWTDTSIKVSTNFHDEDDWALIVRIDPNGNGSYLYSNAFPLKKSQQPPIILSVSPSKINPQGDTVTITGENFGESQSTYSGYLYDDHHVQGTHQILSWSDTAITAIINFADRDWSQYSSPKAGLKIKVKCLDEICKNYGSGIGDGDWKGPPDEYWSNNAGWNLNVQTCTENKWTCSDWSDCSRVGSQSRTCTQTFFCGNAESATPPVIAQSCNYVPPCTADTWECSSWGTCEGTGLEKRSCFKKNDCPSVSTPSPMTTQACTPAKPKCSADVWTCGEWQACSAGGIQARSCSKSFDCPSAETAPPSTAQYCKASQPSDAQQFSDKTETVSDQDNIIKATVKLLCPVDSRRASQGSGTVVDSSGTILTNKHVVSGTLGCLVGFVDKYSDEPYFGSRHIADIVKMSPTQDIAVLKLRNPSSQKLTSVNIYQGTGSPKLGHKITTYGYPAKFGSKMTYTSGDFSGVDGSYVKTTAILEYGNSGGGAYLEDGTFLGIPSLVVKGELNSLGYILSISTIKLWFGGSTTLALSPSSNNYSRVSLLEDVDLSDLDSFELYVPGISPEAPKTTPTQVSPSGEIDGVQNEKNSSEDSIVLEPETLEESEVTVEDQSESYKLQWWKRFFLWLANLFGRLAGAS